MPTIRLEHITKQFSKGSKAVDDMNLVIDNGSFVSLLGPSGCGKTTTLRMIAGLETPTYGEIYIDDHLVFSAEKGINVAPDKRNIGFLFQNYALWPHMTVYQNIAFGLENLKWDKKKIDDRLHEICRTMKIEEYIKRYPAELSGGQQQRVAIARTLATNPTLLLMDEPLSNLDAKLRNDMRVELKRLHKTTHSTIIYVTHDQSEAMTLSTKICLIKSGVVQQYCGPLDLYGTPCNLFTADFIGNPSMNFVPVTGTAEGNIIHLHSPHFEVDFESDKPIHPAENNEYVLGIRPEYIHIQDAGIEGRVFSSLPSGMETTLTINVNGIQLRCVVFGLVDFKTDSIVHFTFAGSRYLLFNKKTEGCIGKGKLIV